MEQKWDQLFTYERRDVYGSNQLENNVTKNLLKTLQDIAPNATSALLNSWFPEGDWDTDSFEYRFQVDVDTVSGDVDYLIGISRFQYNNSPIWDLDGDSSDETDSIADGLIKIPASNGQEMNVVIEVKTGEDPLESEQMSRYRHALDIDTRDRTTTAQWLPLYRQLRTLQYGDSIGRQHAKKSGVTGSATDRPAGQLDRESYLLKELADYLEIEQLKPILAQIGADDSETPTKTFRMFRERNPDGAWPLGSLLFEFEWDEGTSGVGPFHAAAFEHLLSQIGGEGLPERSSTEYHPMREVGFSTNLESQDGRETRREIFLSDQEGASPSVDATALRDWVSEIPTTSSSSGEYFAATRHPPGSYSNSEKFKRLRFEDDGYMSLKHFSEDDNHSQAKPHMSAGEFERLFCDIDASVRAEGLVEPDADRLWQYVLGGAAHGAPLLTD